MNQKSTQQAKLVMTCRPSARVEPMSSAPMIIASTRHVLSVRNSVLERTAARASSRLRTICPFQ